MIEIKTKNIIIGLLIAFLATFVGGWALGRFHRDNTATSIIQGLNDVMRTYVYTIGDLQKSASEAVGSVGHSVAWTGGTLYASSSANLGIVTAGQIGVLTQLANASTTLNIYLTGVWATPK